MARIDEFSFGSIVIDGKKHRKDVLIFVDGRVEKRKGGLFAFGSHNIGRDEIEKITQGEPEAIIIGTGAYGRASLAPDVENWAEERNLTLIVQPSHEAMIKLNDLIEQEQKVAALIHITC